MAIDVAGFRARFPEFEDDIIYPDARVQVMLDDAVLLGLGDDENHWQGKYDIAHAYLAAHYLVLAIRTEAGDSSAVVGPVVSKTAGQVSVTKSVTTKDRSDGDDLLASTMYGMRFLSIRNSCFSGIIAICQ